MSNRSDEAPEHGAFGPAPRTGGARVTAEAQRRGGGPDRTRCNPGRGQPERGQPPGTPPRVTAVELHAVIADAG